MFVITPPVDGESPLLIQVARNTLVVLFLFVLYEWVRYPSDKTRPRCVLCRIALSVVWIHFSTAPPRRALARDHRLGSNVMAMSGDERMEATTCVCGNFDDKDAPARKKTKARAAHSRRVR